MVLGRLYGGGAIVIGTGETDPAALARPLDPDALPRGGLRFLHVVSRWQLSVPAVDRDPLSPWFGEALFYEVVAPERGALRLHPSRVVRFLGNPLPDPSLAASVWSDSVLQALYDAVHAVALTTAGATSLMHEAKVDVVTVPNLSEHLSSADTTAQLSARFAYAAAMKSINNLLLLGDGESWARQRVDFAGLPEMVRTFLQVAAGAADIPVTRLLGQSPAGLSATGESDTRNYYDMIAARQELDLRPQLERLDRLILASEGLDPDALTFAFRPLWQMDAATAATVALTKAQATQIYAGLGLWPVKTLARLVEAQFAEDGTYPGAEAVFVGATAHSGGRRTALDAFPGRPGWNPSQPRDPAGRWSEGVAQAPGAIVLTGASEEEREEKKALQATGGPVPEVQSEDPPLLKPVPGMTPHGPLSSVLMPIPPKRPGAAPTPQPSSLAPPTTKEPTQVPADPASLSHIREPAGTSGSGSGAPRTLQSIEMPIGLTLNARGETIIQRANNYAEEARNALAFNPASPKYEEGESWPDGVRDDDNTGAQVALEAKYLGNSEKGLRDPGRNVSFINQKDVDQARKYLDKFKGGLLWVTNNADLADKYERMFEGNGLSGVRVVFIPSREE